MKSLLYYHLKNAIYGIFSFDVVLIFIFLHQISEKCVEQNKDIINGIADGIVLAILLSLINLLIRNRNHLYEMKKTKESVNDILIISLLKYVYGNKTLPDISQVSLKHICEIILKNIEQYKEKEFFEFQYAIRNDYDSIVQNINVVSKIDSMHSFTYGILISNLNALIKQWMDFEVKFEKYNGSHPINNKTKYYNLYLQSKGLIKIYVNTCLQFCECEFEEFSANFN